MYYPPQKITLKNKQRVVFRSAELEDAENLLQYLKTTAAETPYLLRSPEEVRMTLDEERAFIARIKESPRDLMLLAEIDGAHAGNASFSAVGSYQRNAHRCSVAIAIYRQCWGLGLGRALLSAVLDAAQRLGYEQAELQVNAANTRAIALYESMGFSLCGTMPHGVKYPDGSYVDEHTMVKRFSA